MGAVGVGEIFDRCDDLVGSIESVRFRVSQYHRRKQSARERFGREGEDIHRQSYSRQRPSRQEKGRNRAFLSRCQWRSLLSRDDVRSVLRFHRVGDIL